MLACLLEEAVQRKGKETKGKERNRKSTGEMGEEKDEKEEEIAREQEKEEGGRSFLVGPGLGPARGQKRARTKRRSFEWTFTPCRPGWLLVCLLHVDLTNLRRFWKGAARALPAWRARALERQTE
mmetsp:Transcript_33781/g.66876  ORF Transcript_33781/g.66876 Transcript_33781/m.66876 type:complete len:125 (+) Transcript_33781:163-537(+)